MRIRYQHEEMEDAARLALSRIQALHPSQRFRIRWKKEERIREDGYVFDKVVGWWIEHRVGFLCWREVDLERSLSDQDSQSRVD